MRDPVSCFDFPDKKEFPADPESLSVSRRSAPRALTVGLHMDMGLPTKTRQRNPRSFAASDGVSDDGSCRPIKEERVLHWRLPICGAPR